jgi:hypothetical protein
VKNPESYNDFPGPVNLPAFAGIIFGNGFFRDLCDEPVMSVALLFEYEDVLKRNSSQLGLTDAEIEDFGVEILTPKRLLEEIKWVL